MPEYLTTSEFVRWAQNFDQKLDGIRDDANALRDQVVEHGVDLTALKAVDKKSSAGRSSVISVIVAGIISGVVAYFNGNK